MVAQEVMEADLFVGLTSKEEVLKA